MEVFWDAYYEPEGIVSPFYCFTIPWPDSVVGIMLFENTSIQIDLGWISVSEPDNAYDISYWCYELQLENAFEHFTLFCAGTHADPCYAQTSQVSG